MSRRAGYGMRPAGSTMCFREASSWASRVALRGRGAVFDDRPDDVAAMAPAMAAPPPPTPAAAAAAAVAPWPPPCPPCSKARKRSEPQKYLLQSCGDRSRSSAWEISLVAPPPPPPWPPWPPPPPPPPPSSAPPPASKKCLILCSGMGVSMIDQSVASSALPAGGYGVGLRRARSSSSAIRSISISAASGRVRRSVSCIVPRSR